LGLIANIAGMDRHNEYLNTGSIDQLGLLPIPHWTENWWSLVH